MANSVKNVTLRLGDGVLREARRIAVEEDKSLSQWVSDLIRKTTAADKAYGVAKKRALRRLKTGFNLGAKPLSRDEIYDR